MLIGQSPITSLFELDIIYTYKYLLEFVHLNFDLNFITHVYDHRAGAQVC